MWWIWVVVIIFGLTAFIGAPYIPSHKKDVTKTFKKIKFTEDDVLVDIGSGDGIILREALRAGAGRAIGYEINPILVLLSRFLLIKYSRASVRCVNFWQHKLPDDTTYVYIFSVSRDARKVVDYIKSESRRLNRSLKLISYGVKIDDKLECRHVGAHHIYTVDALQ